MPDDQIQVKITGTDEASPAFDSMADRAVSLGAQFDALMAKMDAATQAQQAASVSMNSMASGLSALAEHAKKVPPVLDEISNGSGKFEKFAENVKGFIEHPLQSAGEMAKGFLMELGPVGAGIAGAAAGMALLAKETFALVNEEGAAARGMMNFADMLNLSFEQTKKLSEMARIVDSDIGTLARASMRIAGAIEDPTSKEGESLKKLGVTATESGEALLQVLQRLADMPDKTTRLAEAHTLLGRAAFQLEPLIGNYDRLKAAIESLGGTLNEDGVQSLVTSREKINELSIAWDHLKEQLAAKLSGVVTIVVEKTTAAVSGSMWDVTGIGAKADALEAAAAKREAEAVKPGPLTAFADSMKNLGIVITGVQTSQQKWAAAHHASITGMHDDLAELEKKQKEIEVELKKPVTADHPFDIKAAAEELANEEKIRTLKERIKAAEKSESGAAVAEKNAALEKQLEGEKKVALLGVEMRRDADKATVAISKMSAEEKQWWENRILVDAENERYEIERKASEKKKALAASTARAEHKPAAADDTLAVLAAQHAKTLAELGNKDLEEQQKNADAMTKLMKEFWARSDEEGRRAFERELALGKRRMDEANRAAEIMANAEIAQATRAYTADKAIVEDDLANHRISVEEKIARLRNLETEEYNSQRAAARGELAHAQTSGPMGGADLSGVATAQAKLDALKAKYEATIAALNRDVTNLGTTMSRGVTKAISTSSDVFLHGLEAWATGSKRFTSAIADSFDHMAVSILGNLVKIGAAQLEALILHKTMAQSQILVDAKTAAVSVAKDFSKIPYVGVVLGPAMGAATFAAMMALGSFEKGGEMPSTGGPFPVMLHKQERVLTAEQTKAYNAGAGGGSTNHYHNYTYHAAPNESPGSITANKRAFVKMAREASRQWMPAGQGAH